ncbi:hypothetical protein DL766_006889 [Monosporascus sp. MC13-8B]|uniref:Zn(2)-C6 fungal-type domain-containing protein n=1 Tax=Monosporascus cannonballus TaxID=155416 RepID=A0ABY0GXG0_9PEZI|nr:hypothetical protein DL762_008012 [Monosporascus cannonballus]RYO96437.1 hypothetical protein DL763_003186 [Monosporascus cannonballus]RYP25931.1 hypothetical protein DL766_006889 [Monosporascus sp. MC13-8B]
MDDNPPNGKPITRIGDVATTSCERCRRRKIKCDKKQPCAGCKKAGTHCIIAGAGEKQRPVPKSYVTALERHVASLELFIQRVSEADNAKRDELLAGYVRKLGQASSDLVTPLEGKSEPITGAELVLAKARAGQLRKLRTGNATQFFGGTSLFQIHASDGLPMPTISSGAIAVPNQATADSYPQPDLDAISFGIFPYSPHHEVCQQLMANFFGAGRYYSEVLLYAICAVGALATGEASMIPVSETFALQAESLAYVSLDQPDLTLLQALILLGYRYIGHGKASKGWLFCGMAFRLAHEMGLHLDPSNWGGPSESHIDREISRRAYWAAFNADKHLSLYFGRPPALYPHESDVRNTTRIPYPESWQSLLETYIAQDVSATAYEDGIALAGAFIYRVELMKIVHNMITDVFENRRHHADGTILAATAQRIHVSLNKWLANLPSKLHWNQWSNGQIQPFVLHLQPPRHLFKNQGIATSDDVEFCYESLQAILKLLKTYSRFYKYSALPLDFVHTLSVAAGTILMKRSLENLSAGDSSISKAMDTVLDAMQEIRHTWPCIMEIRESVLHAMRTEDRTSLEADQDPILDFGFLTSMGSSGVLPAEPGGLDLHLSDVNLTMLIPDEYLAAPFSWDATPAHPAPGQNGHT